MHMYYIVVTWLTAAFFCAVACFLWCFWCAVGGLQSELTKMSGNVSCSYFWCAKVPEGGALHLISCVLCCAASWRWQHFSEEIWQGRVLGASSTEGTTGEGYMHNASSSFSLYFFNTRQNYDHTSLSLHLLLTFLFVCVLLIQEEARKGKGMRPNYS